MMGHQIEADANTSRAGSGADRGKIRVSIPGGCSIGCGAMSDIWHALKPQARAQLSQRDYSSKSLAERLATTGVEAGELVAAGAASLRGCLDPGRRDLRTEKSIRSVTAVSFGEFARQDEGRAGGHRLVAAAVGHRPACSRAPRKAFTSTRPTFPEGIAPEAWFRKLFLEERGNFALAPLRSGTMGRHVFRSGQCRDAPRGRTGRTSAPRDAVHH